MSIVIMTIFECCQKIHQKTPNNLHIGVSGVNLFAGGFNTLLNGAFSAPKPAQQSQMPPTHWVPKRRKGFNLPAQQSQMPPTH